MTRYAELPVWERVPDYHLNSPQSRAIIESTAQAALEARAAMLDAVEPIKPAHLQFIIEGIKPKKNRSVLLTRALRFLYNGTGKLAMKGSSMLPAAFQRGTGWWEVLRLAERKSPRSSGPERSKVRRVLPLQRQRVPGAPGEFRWYRGLFDSP